MNTSLSSLGYQLRSEEKAQEMGEDEKTLGDPTIEEHGKGAIQAMAPPEKPRRNRYVFVCAIVASMASVVTGYDIGVMSGAALFIKDDLNISDVQVEVLVGILNLYALIGSAAAGRTSDWIGRRYTIVVVATIFFASSLLMGFAASYAWLMVGRFVTGVGVGYALNIVPVYIAEISPAAARGFLNSFPDLFINTGILLGYISNYAFARLPVHLSWRLMLGASAIPSIILAISVLVLPESPRWLVMQGHLGKAKQVLVKLSNTKEEANLHLSEIKIAAGIPETATADIVPTPTRSHGEGIWKELLLHPSPPVRRILIAAIGIHFFQQASGVATVVLYSPRIFKKAGIKGRDNLLGATIAVGFTKTMFILVATNLLDKLGRRLLLLTSVAGLVVSLAGLGFGLTVIDHSGEEKVVWAIAICILSVLSGVAMFSIGMGPIPAVYTSEIFPLRLRAQGVSIGIAVNRVISGVVAMTFISLYKSITIGGAYFLYGGIASVAWLFFYFNLRETKGRTLEEMEEVFIGKMGSNQSSVKKDEVESAIRAS